MSTLQISVNGEQRNITAPATLADLLRQIGLDPRMVIVELNRQIVRRPGLETTPLGDGDTVELVHFVGGG